MSNARTPDAKPVHPAELLTKQEVAAFWQVSMRTIQRLIADGRLSVVNPPGMPNTARFRATDIIALPQPRQRNKADGQQNAT
jgi:excisionase family DNA binding protein